MESGKAEDGSGALALGERVVPRPLVAPYVTAEGLVHPPPASPEDTSPYYSDSSLWPEGAVRGVRLCQELSADKWGQAAGASF